MNLKKFTIKSQEVVQSALLFAKENKNQSIENGHLLKAMLEADEHLIPHLLKKHAIN